MRVKSLHIYPVKGMRAVDSAACRVTPVGFEGDRRWMVVDANGRFVTQREQPRLALVTPRITEKGIELSAPGREDIRTVFPDAAEEPVKLWKNDIMVRAAEPAAHEWISGFLGISCRLVWRSQEMFSDSAPVLIVSLASLADLNRRMGKELPVNRFRPNIVIEGAEPWAEDSWRRIRIGKVEFDVVKPCTRCVVTTIDQETGEKTGGNEPLGTLKNFRLIRQPGLTGVVFGQYAVPMYEGIIRVDDAVEVLETQPAPSYLSA